VTACDPVTSGEGLWGGRRLVVASLPSTNREAIANLERYQHGDVLVAREQTEGRGRMDRRWSSPDGKGLTFSVIINEHAPPLLIPTACGQAAAIGVLRLLQGYGLTANLKWPNDVLVSHRKICGILTERDPETQTLVLGVGLNVNLERTDFAAMELRYPATSLLHETGQTLDINVVLDRLTVCLANSLSLAAPERRRDLASEWNTLDAFVGQRIRVTIPGQVMEGTHGGVAVDGALVVIDDDANRRVIYGGDVEGLSAI